MALQNVDRKLFPVTLRPVIRVPESSFAVPWPDGLPRGLCFANLSENYNNRGISQTPGYERLCNSFATPDTLGDPLTFVGESVSFAVFQEEILLEPISVDDYVFEDKETPLQEREEPVVGEIKALSFGNVGFITNDPQIIAVFEQREEQFELYCVASEKVLSKQNKRRVPLCRAKHR
ncbi:MAG TPA: hypothetical protein VG621_03340 [Candidatus Paceibacterota bacterium]|nr:hypothetical protein [Candidatus Paceibacterota bacterium]